MKSAFVFVLIISSFSPAMSCAEGYLFPTDVVPEGKFDFFAGVEKQTYTQSFEGEIGPTLPFRLKEHRQQVTENIGVRYGLGSDWHIGIDIPYTSEERLNYTTEPGSALMASNKSYDFDGSENLRFFLKHRFVGDEASRFSLSGALELEANTANRNYTALSPNLTAGWNWSDDLKGYMGYTGYFSDQDERSTRHAVFVGLHKQVSEQLTLVPEFSYVRYGESRVGSITIATPRNQQTFGVAAQWEFLPDSYLIPSVSFAHLDGFEDESGFEHKDSHDGRAYAVTFYHAF